VRFQRRRSRRAVAGIVATVIMFAILFTVGTSYFIFINSSNQKYVSSLMGAANKAQGAVQETVTLTSLLETNGDVGLQVTDTSGMTVNVTAILVISSTGVLLKCDGVGFPGSAGCANSTPALWTVVDAGATSASIDTGYVYVSGTTDTIKVLTARGNTFTTTYPAPANQSSSSQSVTVNLDNLKWVQLIPQASSLVQKKYVSNCNAAACAASYTSSVTAANILVDAVSWPSSSPPASVPTDTLHDSFTLGASSSVNVASSPAIVQSKYTSNCNAASCGLAFSSNVASGDTLVFGLGWANQSPPSAPTDTRGDTYTLGESQSVTINPPATSLVQSRYTSNCNSVTCGLAYSSSVTAGNTLVFGLGWYGTAPYVPITVYNCESTYSSTLALDGSATGHFSSTNSGTVSLTTTQPNDIIVVEVNDENVGGFSVRTVSSVSGGSLTWNSHSDKQITSSPYIDTAVYYAVASSALSSTTITVNLSGNIDDASIVAFGVSGANTASPWDPGPSGHSLPVYASSTSSSTPTLSTLYTNNANDMLLGFNGIGYASGNSNTETAGSGYALIQTQRNTGGTGSSQAAAEYQIVSATQSAATVAFGVANSDWTLNGDAIQQGSGTSCVSGISADATNDNECDTSATCSVSLTTSNVNDLVYLSITDSGGGLSVNSVSDGAGLTWHLRQSLSSSGNYDVWTYYAIAANVLSSDSVSVTLSSGTSNIRMMVLAASGVNLSAPFDPNLSTAPTNTGSSSTATVTVTTTNANDMIIGTSKSASSSFSGGASGYTSMLCCSSQYAAFEYKVVSATGSNTPTFAISGSSAWGEIGDALEANPGAATPSTFQEMVTWNPSAYSTYEASNLGNIRFCADSACATPLDAWLESCSSTCGPSNTSATAWVKLTSAISSGSSTTIYMVFEGTAVTFDDNYWGEAPNLSGTWGQYDNGANVFTFYDNFAGSSLNAANWQTVIYGGGSITVNNGLTISASTNTYNPILVSKNKYSPSVQDASLAQSSKQTAQATPTVFYATTIPTSSGGDYGFQTGYRYDWYQTSTYLRILGDVSGAFNAQSVLTYTLGSSYNVWSATWAATGSESFALNYSPQIVWTNSGITYGNSYIGISGLQGGQVNVQWERLRAVPPNGIMPLTAFGSVTTGNGSPTGPTDTLGDTFTLGASNSIPVSTLNYYSYIWYTTAASSGADTISATFSSAVTGSVSIYELQGYSTVSPSSSTGSSTGGSTSLSVTSFTPTTNSFVIGNAETSSGSSTYTAGSGYNLVATCSSVYGCSEYLSGSSGARTVQMTIGASAPWVESAIAFAPLTASTYYSYIWYATAGSAGADTISASFGSSVAGSVSIYEISAVTSTGLLASYGSSTTSQSSTSVTSMTPGAGSVVIGNAEVSSTTYTAGSGYTLSGACTSVGGCGEYQTGVGSATTVPFSISPSASWVESAIAFAPTTTNYYSYIWYATAATGGADTVTTTFSGTTAASVSLYEITGYTTSGALSSTGSLATGSTSATVTSFTPASDSFIVGAVEDVSTTNTYTAGSGFTLDGTCSSVEGCSEYNAGGGGSASTIPMTLSSSSGWVEAAISFSTPFNPQSGIQVGGYPTMGVPSGASVVWEVTFTNVDPNQRAVTIWPQTELAIGSAEYDGFDTDYTQAHYYIISSLNPGSTTVNAYSTSSFITLQYNVPTTLYFAATQALGSTTQAFGTNVLTPFEAYFALTGTFSDGTLFGETIPYPYGIITQANAYSTPTAGSTGTTVTMSCTNPCDFVANSKASVGWINSAGQVTQLTTFTVSSSGNIPAGVTFQVPSATAGYYTLEVTDYINTVFMTFQHT